MFRKYFKSNFILKSCARLARPMYMLKGKPVLKSYANLHLQELDKL